MFRILLTLMACALPQFAAGQERYVEDGVFISDALPEVRLRVDPQFEYIGAARFALMETSDVERHHWVVADEGRISAIIILQFEGVMEGVEGSYRFTIPAAAGQAGSNFRFSPERIRLGERDFVHNTWAFDLAKTARLNPRAESARTLALFKEKGYEIDAELIMSRFVTEIGEDRRNELIIFYMEPLGAHGKSLVDFPDGGPPSDNYDELSNLVKRKSLEAIEWLP